MRARAGTSGAAGGDAGSGRTIVRGVSAGGMTVSKLPPELPGGGAARDRTDREPIRQAADRAILATASAVRPVLRLFPEPVSGGWRAPPGGIVGRRAVR